MVTTNIQEYVSLNPVVKESHTGDLYASYDNESDVLYINFSKPSSATHSDLTDDDVIVPYDGDEVIGLTILRTSER